MTCIENFCKIITGMGCKKTTGWLSEYFVSQCILEHGTSLICQKIYRPKQHILCGLVMPKSVEDDYGADMLFKCEQ